eukprot:8532706-Karenia_brevis.AAC.1
MPAPGNRLPNCSACGLEHPTVPHPLPKSLQVQSGFMYQLETLIVDVPQQDAESSDAPQIEEVPEDQ